MFENKTYTIPETVRLKLDYASFIATTMVLFIHSYMTLSPMPKYFQLLEIFIGDGICRIAVPFFFLRSGFLFFLNTRFNQNLFLKTWKRVRTLLIPYIVFIIIGFLFILIISQVQILQQFIVRELPWNTLKGFFKYLLFNPVNYQLWFLRDLIILFLISPLLYFAITYTSWIGVLFVGLLYFLSVYLFIVTKFSLFYFIIGGTIALKRPGLIEFKRTKWFWIILASYIILALYNATTKVYECGFSEHLNISLNIVGIYCLWYLVDFLTDNKLQIFQKYWSLSFFIYLAHEPLLTFVKKFLFKIAPTNNLIYSLLYLLTPLFILLVVVSSGAFFKHIFPRIYNFISGGR